MKIIVVGGTGLIGRAVVKELAPRHEVITVGHKNGDKLVDITNRDSINKLFQDVGQFDALIATTGKVCFMDFARLKDEEYRIGINDKLMGQINLVTIGYEYIKDHGSFTLTSGILNHDPIRGGTAAAMVNGALEGFVTGAAVEMQRGVRINLVSPTVLVEVMEAYGPYFPGFEPVAAEVVARAYTKSVEGPQTGSIYRVGY